jgi:hypothetical protein
MRGAEPGQVVLFSYVALDDWIPADHPVRPLKALVGPVLAELSPRFTALYARDVRASIPPRAVAPGPAAAGALYLPQRAVS